MPTISATVENRVRRSFRVAQVEGMFGETIRNKRERFLKCDLPGIDDDWRIGLVVGPSGSGKTTIARAAFGDAVCVPGDWPTDRAIVDGFGERPIKQIVRTLTAVGLGSPPSWVRPYDALSTGERFRCDLARAILECGMRNAESREGKLVPRALSLTSSRPLSIAAWHACRVRRSRDLYVAATRQ